MTSSLQIWAQPLALVAIANLAGTWYKLVSEHVPGPYLDEVFHIPQAQRYCQRNWAWDPKITTPPGLYLLSLLLKPVIGGCDTSSLRILNVAAIAAICFVAYEVLRILRSRPGQVRKELVVYDENQVFDAQAALNISLCPPLFFFSGLYYTDVISTLIVLLSYRTFLKRQNSVQSLWSGVITVLYGAAALSFRQTNIFWVAVFPAGLTVVEVLKKNESRSGADQKMTLSNVLQYSWNYGKIHDVAVGDASLQDYVLLLSSLVLAALRSLTIVLKAVVPYAVLIVLFAVFVAWNGGVVLGDKSNHVATIHLPQMLYIWPYIAFFSFPLLITSLVEPLIRRLPDNLLKSFYLKNISGPSTIAPPGLTAAFLFLTLGLASVHYNTIIHPFTLADNRHYVFYVFRVIRRHPAIKYLAVPIYYICAWVTLQMLNSGRHTSDAAQAKKDVPPTRRTTGRQPCRTSFIVVWLATTAMSVISAPLVEPRYFIVPWLMWRLHVPNAAASLPANQSARKTAFDVRLALETTWHLAIDAAVGYLFLYRGFSWPNEPGRVQRFMF